MGYISHESVAFRGCLNVKRMGPDTLTHKSSYGTMKLGFKGVVQSSPFGALAQDQEGGQCSQERFSEFPESSDPTAGLKVLRV